MKNKYIALLVCGLAISLVSCSSGDSLEIRDISQANLYFPQQKEDGTFGIVEPTPGGKFNYAVTKTYGEYEAMVSLDDVLSLVINASSYGDGVQPTKNIAEGVVSYTLPVTYVSIKIDTNLDTITFSDYDRYCSGANAHVNDFSSYATVNFYETVESSYSYTAGSEKTFDLKAYDIPVYLYRETVFLPTAVASYVFFSYTGYTLTFNGSDFFICYSSSNFVDSSTNTFSEFGKKYYDSPIANQSQNSESIATLHGNESMFFLDNFYGFIDYDKFNGSFSNYLKENYASTYDQFYSQEFDEPAKAWDYTLRYIIGDGHSSTTALGNFGTGGIHTRGSDVSERYANLASKSSEYSALREEKLGFSELDVDSLYQEYNSMAIIRFDSFIGNNSLLATGDAYYYYQNMESDVYSQFAYSFYKIKENENIDKVVIDLTCNGGGLAIACLAGLSYLMDEVPYYVYNPTTGASTKAVIKGNLPGRTSSYAGEYDFYVMISDFSFSCGNLFPTVVKNTGAATVIGKTSGGGACIVKTAVSPDGQIFSISGTSRLSLNGGKEDNDAGIAPDIELDSSYWYDLAKLEAKLNEVA